MDQKLDFKFIAISQDSFTLDNSQQNVMITYDRDNPELFTSKIAKRKKLSGNKTSNSGEPDGKEIELYSLHREDLLQLCDTFPKTATVL